LLNRQSKTYLYDTNITMSEIIEIIEPFNRLLESIDACTLCTDILPYPPKPIVNIGRNSQILIIGQAPGLIAHETNQPWNDKSGDRLRQWLCIDRDTFYNTHYLSLIPMGFCFPGYKNKADAPPTKACAPQWHAQVRAQVNPTCTLLVGRYAQQYYAGTEPTLTQAIKSQPLKSDNTWVLPHPSGRNNRWLTKNPWFESSILPLIQEAVSLAISGKKTN